VTEYFHFTMYSVFYTAEHYRKQPRRTANHLMQAIPTSHSNKTVAKCRSPTAEMFIATFSWHIRELLNWSINALCESFTTIEYRQMKPLQNNWFWLHLNYKTECNGVQQNPQSHYTVTTMCPLI